MKKIAVLLMTLFFLGCNSVEQLEQQWLGKNKSMLIALKGTPDKVISDGFGGEIYTYYTVSSYPEYDWPYGHYPGYGYWRGHHYYHYHYRETITGKTMFWIDPYDKIYRVGIAP